MQNYGHMMKKKIDMYFFSCGSWENVEVNVLEIVVVL